MTEGEAGGLPIALPTDLPGRGAASGTERQRVPWLAILAAASLHAAVLFWLLVNWSHPATPPHEPDVIPVRVVVAPPAPVALPVAPLQKPPAPPAYRESGPDQRTAAPAPAEMPAPEAATPPAPAPTPAEKETPPPPPEKPTPAPLKQPPPEESAKSPPRKEVARLEPLKKEAETTRAPHPAPPRHLNVEPGDHFESGDPYLNQLHALIERHRIYPRVIGPFGLPTEGTAVYDVAVDRSGRVLGLRLDHSSGIAGIDQAVETMIRSSLPFPPLPADYPDEISIVVAIRLFPPS